MENLCKKNKNKLKFAFLNQIRLIDGFQHKNIKFKETGKHASRGPMSLNRQTPALGLLFLKFWILLRQ